MNSSTRQLLTGALSVLLLAAGAGCAKPPLEKAFEYASSAPSYSTPLVVGKLVVFGNEAGSVTAVDKETGQHRWRFETYKSVIAAPRFANGLIFFGSENWSLYAVDMNGQERWKYTTRSPIKSDALVQDNVVYFSSYDGHAYAVTADTRKIIWIFPTPRIDEQPPAPRAPAPPGAAATATPQALPQEAIVPGAFSYSSPVYSNGVVYLGNLDGYLYALNAADGTIKWRFKTDAGVTSTALVDKGVIYFGSQDTYLYAIDEATGANVKWKFKTGNWVLSSPKLKDGVIYIGSDDKHLYAVDANSGKEVCKFKGDGEIISYPAFVNGLVVVCGGNNDGQVYALKEKTCQELWRFKTGYQIKSDPVVDGDMVYVTSGDRKLYGFKVRYKPEK